MPNEAVFLRVFDPLPVQTTSGPRLRRYSHTASGRCCRKTGAHHEHRICAQKAEGSSCVMDSVGQEVTGHPPRSSIATPTTTTQCQRAGVLRGMKALSVPLRDRAGGGGAQGGASGAYMRDFSGSQSQRALNTAVLQLATRCVCILLRAVDVRGILRWKPVLTPPGADSSTASRRELRLPIADNMTHGRGSHPSFTRNKAEGKPELDVFESAFVL